jgi:hypothetical protein
MNNKPRPRKLSASAWHNRGRRLAEEYISYLRDRHPMGSVVAINVATGEHVVGGASPIALEMYWDKFGKEAQDNLWLEPIHWPNTRPMHDEIAEVKEWFRQRNAL